MRLQIACARVCYCMSEDCACTGLPCDVPGVFFGKVGFLLMAARPAAQPKATGAEELPVPKLSLALRHMCRQGVGEAKRVQNISRQRTETTCFGTLARCTYS